MREHHPRRVAQTEKLRRRLAAVKDDLRGAHGGPVARAAGIGAGLHCLCHSAENSRGLLQRGCCRVQIDHSSTSRQPSEVCSYSPKGLKLVFFSSCSEPAR